jgi:diguanylate cyclase (GGDEF)-like protein
LEIGEIILNPALWLVLGLGIPALVAALRLANRKADRKYSGRKAVVEGMSDGILVVDTKDGLLDLNRAARSILDLHGTSPHGQPLSEVLGHHPDLLELFRGAIDGHSEMSLQEADGTTEVYDLQWTALYDSKGEIKCRVLTLRDFTQRAADREELKRESINVQLLQEVAVAANDSSSIEDALRECLRLICSACEWSVGHVLEPDGATNTELRSSRIWYLSNPDGERDFVNLAEQVSRSAQEGLPGRAFTLGRPVFGSDQDFGDSSGYIAALVKVKYERLTGVSFPIVVGDSSFAVMELYIVGPRAVDAHLLEVLGHLGSLIGRAIERKLDAEKIRRLAFHDSLTQLPNRESFRVNLNSAVKGAIADKEVLGLLFIDLDGFKRVNDNLGHSAGDELLRHVADRFLRVIRTSDRVTRGDREVVHKDSIARVGGDEFTVLLKDINRPEDAARVAERLLAALREPIEIGSHEFFIGASIGLAVFPTDGDNAESLLQNADAAMYFAKGRGRNCYQFYSESMNKSGARRLMIEEHLRGALERGEFSLRYQPLRDSKTNIVVATEALLRWEDPDEGFIGPDEFIPIAEESGLIISLGAWVLREACQQAMKWVDQGFCPIRMSVNLSGYQIRANNFVGIVDEILAETRMSPGLLELEITESTIMQNDELTTDTLQALYDMGIGLALDDFGTGYSSINYLRQFPINRLKIDRSFVSDLMSNPDDAALTGAIIAMAHSLRVAVVAEGVETEEQACFLRKRGCEELQGYLISPPIDAVKFRRFLVREKEDEADLDEDEYPSDDPDSVR